MTDSTLSITAGPTERPLLEETIPANLARTVAQHGEREALVSCHQDIRWSWNEFHARVRQLARGLLGLGLAKGDRGHSRCHLGTWRAFFGILLEQVVE